MGLNHTIKGLGLALLTSSVLSTSAIAGGFDRGGVNIDALFDESRFATDVQVSYVSPRRTARNVQRTINAAAPLVGAGALVAAVNGVGAGVTNPADAEAFLIGLLTSADPVDQATGAAIQAGVAATTAALAPPDSSARIDQEGDFVVPRLSAKFNVGTGLDCLATYTEPFGADNENGTNNALSASAVDFSIDTQDYGLTCAYEFGAGNTSVGDSFISIVGGVSYQELQGFLARQSFLDLANAGITGTAGVVPGGTVTNTSGLGTFNVDGNTIGWRAGVAYEIPDIALRALLIYHSSYDYDLSGIQDNRGFGIDPAAGNATAPITANTEIPQAIELKLQSGIAEGTLAFANFKWQDWSQIDIVPIIGGVTATAVGPGNTAIPTNLAFEAGYRDGYTVNAGIGRQLNENLSALVSLGWDRGTSTDTGTQTDSWTLSGGLRYTEGENVEFRVGGAVGLLEGGSSTALPNSIDPANAVTYEFDTDFILAVSGGFKYKF